MKTIGVPTARTQYVNIPFSDIRPTDCYVHIRYFSLGTWEYFFKLKNSITKAYRYSTYLLTLSSLIKILKFKWCL